MTTSLNTANTITVLLVDDDDQVRRLCKHFLVESGFRVLEADNGMEALLIAAEHEGAIDLVITDLEMPRISGAELGRAINKLWPRLNVLFMSGSLRSDAFNELPGDCAFLPKPFGPEALLNAVESCIGVAAEA